MQPAHRHKERANRSRFIWPSYPHDYPFENAGKLPHMESETTYTPYRDGPILVRGPVSLTDPNGEPVATRRKTIALCRCGYSSIRPLCDGTHKAIGFTAEGRDGRDVARSDGGVPCEG